MLKERGLRQVVVVNLLDEKTFSSGNPDENVYFFQRAKIWNYPAHVKTLHFVPDTEIMGSVERVSGQVGIIHGKFPGRILFSGYFDGHATTQT